MDLTGEYGLTAGMFTYGPGRIPPPAHLGLPDTLIKGSFTPGLVGLITPARQAKRVYIGNITSAMKESDIKAFFEKLMRERSLASDRPGNVVELVQLNTEKLYGFVEVSPSIHYLRKADASSARLQKPQPPSLSTASSSRTRSSA